MLRTRRFTAGDWGALDYVFGNTVFICDHSFTIVNGLDGYWTSGAMLRDNETEEILASDINGGAIVE
jgi:hypothetical protein